MPVVAVVDDDPDLRALMVLRLEAAGLKVHQSADGASGLDLIKDQRPDLVVVDWMMPGKTGIEVCRAIRADPGLAATPVLMVTSRASAADQETGLAAGVTVVLTKPFDLRTFLEHVRGLLERADAGGVSSATYP